MNDKTIKLVFISSMLPDGHFSQILCKALHQYTDLDLIVYADKNPQNLEIKNCGTIKTIWRKGFLYVWDIIKELRVDKPDIVHIQHELGMYGNIYTAIVFPFLLLYCRVVRIPVVTTIHAAVYKKEIDTKFTYFFHKEKSRFLTPFTLKLFFHVLFYLTSLLSTHIVNHSHLLKKILTQDYGVDRKKITVVPTTIPENGINSEKKEKYFLYFGYIVRRKGLGNLIQGFSQFIKKHPDYKLVLAGGTIKGQEEAMEEIKKRIKQLNLKKNIIMTGFIKQRQIDELYAKAYAVVMPAEMSMGSSGPLYHAQSYKKCILASDIGHFKEDIDHLKNGILVNNNKWEQALTLIAEDPALVKKIEKGVVKRAQEKSPKNIAGKYYALYSILAFSF